MSWHKVADGSRWDASGARYVLDNEFGHPADDPHTHPVEWVDRVADRIYETIFDRDDLDPVGLMIEAQAWAEEVTDQWTWLWEEEKETDGSGTIDVDVAPAEEDGLTDEPEYDPFEPFKAEGEDDTPAKEAECCAPSEEAIQQDDLIDSLTFYEFLTSEPAQKKQKSSAEDPAPWHYDSDPNDAVNTPPEGPGDEDDDSPDGVWGDSAN